MVGGLVAAMERVQGDVTEISDIKDGDARTALALTNRTAPQHHSLPPIGQRSGALCGAADLAAHRQADFVLAGKLFQKSEVCSISCRFGSLKRRIFP